MPRKRMLWPGFFESHNLGDIEDINALLTYQGIWVFGDDRGRILDDPDEIWLRVWPRRRKQVSALDVAGHISALVSGEQVCRYQVGGGRFLHTIAWDEHQSINHPTMSKLPPCQEHQPAEWSMWWKDDDTATDRWRRNEKAAQKAKTTQVATTGVAQVATTSQFSSVQVSSVKAKSGSDSGSASLKNGSNVRDFLRPSQSRVSGDA